GGQLGERFHRKWRHRLSSIRPFRQAAGPSTRQPSGYARRGTTAAPRRSSHRHSPTFWRGGRWWRRGTARLPGSLTAFQHDLARMVVSLSYFWGEINEKQPGLIFAGTPTALGKLRR